MVNVTLLGTAALMPLPERALSAAYLTCGGRGLLLDCGEGTQAAARRAGISLMKTDIIALSHYHGDHVFGLPGLLQSMNALDRAEPLYITGPAGIESELAPILTLAGEVKYPIRLIEVPDEGLELRSISRSWPNGARLQAFETKHRVISQGYVFTLHRAGKFLPERARALSLPVECWGKLQNGRSVEIDGRLIEPEMVLSEPRRGIKVLFSGDTAPCESMLEAARDAQLLILDATYGEDEQAELAEKYGHMTFSQAAQLAGGSGAEVLWLSHYSPMIKNPGDYIHNARRYFENSHCGYDGMSASLKFED